MARKGNNDEELVVEEWSKKRILIGFLVALVVLGAGLVLFKSVFSSLPKANDFSAQAEQAKNIPTPSMQMPSQKDVQQIITKVRGDLSHINTGNIISSQKQIANVISELQRLQSGKESTKDFICSLVCK